MKKIDVTLWELTKEEVCQKGDSDQVLIYNSLCKTFKIEYCDKKCIARNKHASEYLKYFSFAEDSGDCKEEYNDN